MRSMGAGSKLGAEGSSFARVGWTAPNTTNPTKAAKDAARNKDFMDNPSWYLGVRT